MPRGLMRRSTLALVVCVALAHLSNVLAILPYKVCRQGMKLHDGTTYSVSGLSLPSSSYNARDIVADDVFYRYNICAPVPSLPPFCKEDDQGASAFRIKTNPEDKENKGECKRLTSKDQDPTVELLDKENPTAGFVVTHTGGEDCDGKGTFIIRMHCSDDTTNTIERESVLPDNNCVSRLIIQTRKACPVECPVGQDAGLCNGKGLCRFDQDEKASRCFCYEGYGGKGCDQPETSSKPKPSSGLNSTQSILVFVIIALSIIFVLALALMRYLLKARVSRDVPSADASQDSSFMYSRPNPADAFDSEQTLFSVQ